jgi:two-component system chemotaxis response regulator CheY
LQNNLIFVVDDSKTVRASLAYILKKAGYQVEAADNGMEGIRKLDELAASGKKPAMIITDINMPEMDGISFIKEIKKKNSLKYIPILVLTTESQNDKKIEGKNAGAAGWLVKPFKAEQLTGVVKKFVR